MQPQDNDFPLNQVQGGGMGDNNAQAGQPTDAVAPLAAGATFQPQAGGIAASAPTWHNDAINDANQVYAQSGGPDPASPAPMDQPPANPAPAPSADISNDFGNSANLASANPLTAQEPATEPIQQTEAAPLPNAPTEGMNSAQPQLSPKEPIQYEVPQQPMANETAHIGNDPYTQQQQGLPGSENLGAAVAYVYQQDQMQQSQVQMDQAYQPQMQQPMPSNVSQTPKKSKKWIFILLGVIIALAAIGGGVYYYLSMRKTTETPIVTPTTDNTVVTPTPTAGPATPPAGYETIAKQCYSFALYVPNTVPKDEACSFAESTFGNKKISKIAVETSTNEYKTVDEFLSLFKSSVTLVSENKIKLNDLEATQIIYKFTDGRTYSKIFTLLVGKSYQQDGKPVTGLALTTSYQETFDVEVTNNVIDTWRWQ